MNNVYFAFFLTLLAGLSTGIGSFIAFFAKNTNKTFLSVSLGFSAGVMIYVSMIEIFSEAQKSLTSFMGERVGGRIKIDSSDFILYSERDDSLVNQTTFNL